MVMPYGIKKTDVVPGTGPQEINFDVLWDRALQPAIEKLGYEPVRADQDIGALIIHEMLERLYFADLVLADMTIPNGNVYYEVGIRHACQQFGCVLLAADWSRPLFDVAQNRTVRYPLPMGTVDEAAAAAIIAAVVPAAAKLARGSSPMHEVLKGFPDSVDASRASSMRQKLSELSAFQARVTAVRAAGRDARSAMLATLIAGVQNPIAPPVAHALLNLCRDLGAWRELVDLVNRLPDELARIPRVIEIKSLAQSKLGETLVAIGALEQLVLEHGATSEREGLLGGRYKELYLKTAPGSDKANYLNQAIKHYEAGMMMDLNDFYPSSNLPRLYRARGLSADLEKARAVAEIVNYACRRARVSQCASEWVRPTLLGVAFDRGDARAAQEYYEQIVGEGAQDWHLASILVDLEISVSQADPARQADLRAILARLKELTA
jgi:hypothetical protein